MFSKTSTWPLILNDVHSICHSYTLCVVCDLRSRTIRPSSCNISFTNNYHGDNNFSGRLPCCHVFGWRTRQRDLFLFCSTGSIRHRPTQPCRDQRTAGYNYRWQDISSGYIRWERTHVSISPRYHSEVSYDIRRHQDISISCTNCDISGNLSLSGGGKIPLDLFPNSQIPPGADVLELHPDFNFTGLWVGATFDELSAHFDFNIVVNASNGTNEFTVFLPSKTFTKSVRACVSP